MIDRVGLLFLTCLLAGCITLERPFELENLRKLKPSPSEGWDRMAEGDTSGACEIFWATKDPVASDLYGQAECARRLGQFGRSTAAYLALYEKEPAGYWTAFGASHLPYLWDLAPGDSDRRRSACETLRKTVSAPAWTRYRASLCAMEMDREVWSESDAQVPFDGSPYGAPTVWNVVGPTSIYGNLDFDEETDPEKDERLAESYTLRGFPVRTTLRTAQEGSHMLRLGGLSGVYVAETFLELEQQAELDAVVDYPGLVLVRVNGVELLRRDDRKFAQSKTLLRRGIVLGPGRHRVTMRVAVERGYKRDVGLMFLHRSGGALAFRAAAFGPDHPVSRPGGLVDAPLGAVLDAGKTARWLPYKARAGRRRMHSNSVVLSGVFGVAVKSGDPWITFAALGAMPEGHMARYEATRSDWNLPAEQRNKDALTALQRAVKANPDELLPRLRLAALQRELSSREGAEASIDVLRSAGTMEPEIWREIARYYDWRELPVEAEAAWRRVLKLDPQDCLAAVSIYGLMRDRDAVPQDWESAPPPCGLARWLRARDVLVAQGEPSEHLAFLQRRVARAPDVPSLWKEWIEGVRAQDVDRAMKLSAAALDWHPADTGLALLAADLYDGQAQQAAAREVLLRAIENGAESGLLYRRLMELGGQLPMEELMADGLAAIRNFEADDAPPVENASAIYVLDYMARRYFDDGSAVDLVHLVVKVLAKEGLDEHGEVAFPRGALPLRLRTIKQGGRVVEPQAQAGKKKVSMVGLDVGDYVETLYLVFRPAISVRKGSTTGLNFYFKMANIASAHSEFVMETPLDWDPELNPRNGPPTAEITEVEGRRRYRFLRTGSAQPRREPNAPGTREFLPHVSIRHRYGDADFLRFRRNQVAGTASRTPELARAVRTVRKLAGRKKKGKIRAKWELAPFFEYASALGTGPGVEYRDLSTPASFIQERNHGNRAVFLRALLLAAGVDASLWLARRNDADPVDDPRALSEEYRATLVLAKVGGEDVWLYPGRNHPFAVLPDQLQGATAISLEPAPEVEKVVTPVGSDGENRLDVEINASVGPDGLLKGTIRLYARNYSAQGFRTRLENLGSRDKTRKFLEGFVNYLISGGTLSEWRTTDLEKPDKPLIVELDFQRPGYARTGPGGEFLIEDRYFFPDITRRYGRLAERTIPMAMSGYDGLVRLNLTVPDGRQVVAEDLTELAIESPFGVYTRKVSTEDGKLQVEMRLDIKAGRVTPAQYQDFVSWSGDVDRGTYLRIAIR